MQAQLFTDRMEMLTRELNRIQEAQSAPPPSAIDQVAQALQTVQAVEEFRAKLLPVQTPQPQAPAHPMVDPNAIKLYEIRQDFEYKRWDAERADRHEERMEQIRLAHALEEKRLKLEEAAAAQSERFVNQTLPQLAALAQQALEKVTGQDFGTAGAVGGGGGGGGGAAAQVRAQVDPSRLPPDVHQDACPGCGTVFFWKESFGGAVCPGCGAVYATGDDGSGQPAEAPARQNMAMGKPVIV